MISPGPTALIAQGKGPIPAKEALSISGQSTLGLLSRQGAGLGCCHNPLTKAAGRMAAFGIYGSAGKWRLLGRIAATQLSLNKRQLLPLERLEAD